MNLLHDLKVCFLATVVMCTGPVLAQSTQSQPVNDSAAQASPVGRAATTPATDTSEQASPTSSAHSPGRSVAARTTVHVTLDEPIDSGSLKNGQTVHARIRSVDHPPSKSGWSTAEPSLRPGTPVLISVIASVPAGKLNAVGELSLELTQIGKQIVYTDTQTFRGEPGKRDLPDSAPTVGTNAGLAAGAALSFTVRPEPYFSEADPGSHNFVPGSVTKRASGSKPANYGQPTVSAAPGSDQGVQNGNLSAAPGTTPATKPH